MEKKKHEDIEYPGKEKGEGKHDESSNDVLAAPGWERIEHQWINNQQLSLRNENFVEVEI